jgi:hypothetical protein
MAMKHILMELKQKESSCYKAISTSAPANWFPNPIFSMLAFTVLIANTWKEQFFLRS